MMLYMTAQTTRKNPESLPMYKPLFDESIGYETPKKMSGEEILADLIANSREGL
ncbi:MAG: hypothetical protein FWE24_09140 [Defluviitaleaceae bacterium]|nr:hypothetical protein [Defluviitaleaceae bacterium]